MIVLGIETSCDETSVAVVDGNRILSNIISSQVKIHEKFGGVVPELASRHHLDNIDWVLDHAVHKSGVPQNRIEGIGVTYGPGLVGSLLVGVNLAKALAYSWSIPFVGINHLEAHLHSVFLDHPAAELPMLCVIASGGHTSLYHLETKDRYTLLGETRDDAIGEAFDKVGKLLGLGYPGGPVIDRLAACRISHALALSKPNFNEDTYDFSYSGLKTAILYHVSRTQLPPYSGAGKHSDDLVEICRAFQTMAIEILMSPLRKAVQRLKPGSVSFSGGVACNSYLRKVGAEFSKRSGLPVYFPSMVLSTDNAAMIAAVAHHKLTSGQRDSMDLNAQPNLRY